VADADRIAAALNYVGTKADPLESFRSLEGLKGAYDRRVQPIINSAKQTFMTGGLMGDVLRAYGNAAAPTNAAVLSGMGMPSKQSIAPLKEQTISSGENFVPMGDPQQQAVGQFIGDPLNFVQPVASRLANAVKFAKPDALKALKEMSQGARSPLDVYHGTPHTMPPTPKNPLGEFDPTKIGSGEGAQAYGYGHYVAEAPAVSKQYQTMLAPEKNVSSLNDKANFVKIGDKSINPDTFDIDISQELIDAAKSGKNEFLNFVNQRKLRWQELANDKSYKFNTYAQDKLNEYNNLIKETKKSGVSYTGSGNLYKIDLADKDIPKMLDWDNPIPENVRQKISSAAMDKFGSGSTGTSGESLYKELTWEFKNLGSSNPAADASNFLRQQGIPGIKYLDEMSRSSKYKGDTAYLHAANDFKINNYSLNDALEGMKKAYKNADQKELKDALDAAYTAQTRNFVVFPGEEESLKILGRE
jgi:hypothetical protein